MHKQLLTLALASSLSAGLFAMAPMALAATAQQTPPPQDQSRTMPSNPTNSEINSNDTINCKMDFTLSGWSAIYKTASGQGKVHCDNGQTMNVHLEARGAGLSAGAYKINDGEGNFTGVSDINQILGTYGKATAHAGAVKSSHAAVMTKGDVTLTVAGTGNGWNIGVGFEGFTIKRASQANSDPDSNQ